MVEVIERTEGALALLSVSDEERQHEKKTNESATKGRRRVKRAMQRLLLQRTSNPLRMAHVTSVHTVVVVVVIRSLHPLRRDPLRENH